MRKKRNHSSPYASNFGGSAFHAKLTNAQALQIWNRGKAGESQSDLAREFGVTRNSVWNLLNGRAWSRVINKQLGITCEQVAVDDFERMG